MELEALEIQAVEIQAVSATLCSDRDQILHDLSTPRIWKPTPTPKSAHRQPHTGKLSIRALTCDDADLL